MIRNRIKQRGRSTISRAAFTTKLLYNKEGASKRENSNMQSKDSKTKDSRNSRDSRKRKPSQDKEGKYNKRKPC